MDRLKKYIVDTLWLAFGIIVLPITILVIVLTNLKGIDEEVDQNRSNHNG